MPDSPRSVSRLGYLSGVAAALLAVVYVLAQVAEWAGLLGSAGGPASAPFGLVVLLAPSLLLAPPFAVLMVSLHRRVPAERRVWTHAAVVFATVYTVLVGLIYYVQLTFVVPNLLRGEPAGLEPFLFVPFDSFLYSVELLGYSFMSLATLFAAAALAGPGLERTARLFLAANGLLLPFLALEIYYSPLIWPASLWAVTFPGAALSLAALFGRDLQRATGTPLTTGDTPL